MKDIVIIKQQVATLAKDTKSAEMIKDELSNLGIDGIVAPSGVEVYVIQREGYNLAIISQQRNGHTYTAATKQVADELDRLNVNTVVVPPGIDMSVLTLGNLSEL